MEWLIAAGAALGSLVVTAAVVFRRSLGKARRGGRAKVDHIAKEAERIRAAANRRLLETEIALPRLRVEARSKKQAGTLHRDVDSLRTRQRTAEERARRAAQSFNAIPRRHRDLLHRLDEAGLLVETPTGPMIDTRGLSGRALEVAAAVGRDLQELEWYRENGLKDGISGPLGTPAFTEERAQALREELQRPGRVDEEGLRERTRRAVSGHDLLTDAPASLAEAVRGRTGPARRISVTGARGGDDRTPGRAL
ncbi:hypothetical protein DFP74_1824 [Nocardiopsis sp. Huas11]|uniref:hypothetical protein n=1 Tax=Nocardiopsis sp. Huas11 TaxID=2183912 RepID=UPI000EAD2A20|nr:hypothetical protein [Nocardiopsis sp. Huas11]RKS06200.1 hypothetical protein DFP74_1824 [Nocardiopsis sp. Huas11]